MRLSKRVNALEKVVLRNVLPEVVIVIRLVKPGQKNDIRLLESNGQRWERGDDEDEQAFIARAKSEVKRQADGHVALLFQE